MRSNIYCEVLVFFQFLLASRCSVGERLALKAPANEETLLRKHCFQNVSWLRKRAGNIAPWHGKKETFHCKQTFAHALLEEMQSARPWNLVNIVSSARKRKRGNICCGNKLFVRVRANGETFRETCFRNNVFATMFPRLWETQRPL